MFNQITDAALKAKKLNSVNLVVVVVDDSYSIHEYRNEDNIVRACNGFIEGIIQADGGIGKYWLGVQGMNGLVHKPLSSVSPGSQIGRDEFDANGRGTPLYRSALRALQFQMDETERLEGKGLRVRTATVVLTDGADNQSSSDNLRQLHNLAQQMGDDPKHQLFGIGLTVPGGIGLKQHVRGASVGGLLDRWIGTDNTASGGQEGLYPSEYHVVFEREMGFVGDGAFVESADNAEELAAKMKQFSQSVARTGAVPRVAKKGF